MVIGRLCEYRRIISCRCRSADVCPRTAATNCVALPLIGKRSVGRCCSHDRKRRRIFACAYRLVARHDRSGDIVHENGQAVRSSIAAHRIHRSGNHSLVMRSLCKSGRRIVCRGIRTWDIRPRSGRTHGAALPLIRQACSCCGNGYGESCRITSATNSLVRCDDARSDRIRRYGYTIAQSGTLYAVERRSGDPSVIRRLGKAGWRIIRC